MKSFFAIIILLSAAIFQTTLVPFLALRGVIPNLVLVLILFWVILKSFKEVWWLIILAGLFLDLLSGLPFGLISLSLLITAYLIDRFNSNVFSEIKIWLVAVLIALGSLFYNFILIAIAEFFILVNLSQKVIYSNIFSWDYLITLFLVIAYNSIALLFLYGIKKIFYQKQSERGY